MFKIFEVLQMRENLPQPERAQRFKKTPRVSAVMPPVPPVRTAPATVAANLVASENPGKPAVQPANKFRNPLYTMCHRKQIKKSVWAGAGQNHKAVLTWPIRKVQHQRSNVAKQRFDRRKACEVEIDQIRSGSVASCKSPAQHLECVGTAGRGESVVLVDPLDPVEQGVPVDPVERSSSSSSSSLLGSTGSTGSGDWPLCGQLAKGCR